jgi:formylglycine-generating enzyme required for sulfatase activity
VTNAAYRACVSAGVCTPPNQTSSGILSNYYDDSQYDNYPVFRVDWDQAKTYCEWRGGSLPTEAQWEKAARGTDARIYPWGNTFDGTEANFCDKKNCPDEIPSIVGDDGYAYTSPVGSYESGKSPYGIYDLAGNVWEWVADWFDENYYANSPSSNPLGPSSGKFRVLRGGAWNELEDFMEVTSRFALPPDYFNYAIGFRCVRSISP